MGKMRKRRGRKRFILRDLEAYRRLNKREKKILDKDNALSDITSGHLSEKQEQKLL